MVDVYCENKFYIVMNINKKQNIDGVTDGSSTENLLIRDYRKDGENPHSIISLE